jgi:hypothetical protein
VGGTGGEDAGDADVSEDVVEDISVDVEAEADAPEADVSVDVDADTTETAVDTGPDVGDCPNTVEVCTNGIDDDCDGLVDCADPHCNAGYACLGIPSGWDGYYAVYDGPTGSGVPNCTSGFPVGGPVLYRNPQGSAAVCSTCSCDAPQGVACGDPHIWIGGNLDCAGQGWTLNLPNPGTCYTLNMPSTTDGGPPTVPESVEFDPPKPDPNFPGSCAASQVNISKDEPGWGRIATSCQHNVVGGGCSAPTACVPKPGTEFSRGVCILRAGVWGGSCPSPYVNKYTYYQTLVDTRTCTDCSCGTPVGAQCEGTVEVDNSPGCGSPEVMLSTLACSNDVTPNTTQYVRRQTTLVSSGTCAVSGGVSTGSVEPDLSTAFTACCWLPN